MDELEVDQSNWPIKIPVSGDRLKRLGQLLFESSGQFVLTSHLEENFGPKSLIYRYISDLRKCMRDDLEIRKVDNGYGVAKKQIEPGPTEEEPAKEPDEKEPLGLQRAMNLVSSELDILVAALSSRRDQIRVELETLSEELTSINEEISSIELGQTALIQLVYSKEIISAHLPKSSKSSLNNNIK